MRNGSPFWAIGPRSSRQWPLPAEKRVSEFCPWSPPSKTRQLGLFVYAGLIQQHGKRHAGHSLQLAHAVDVLAGKPMFRF